MLEVVKANLLDSMYGPAGFDGVWSKQSRALLSSDKYITLNKAVLDRNWVITPQDFVCSICNRSKQSLAELEGESLVASLHCDHDHIGDLIQAKSKELNVLADIRPLVSSYAAYEPIIVCKACNWIDSQVKKMVPKVHKYFSFPPKDKKCLIKEFGRRRHKIDKKLAQHRWNQRAKAFSCKLNHIERDLQDYLGTHHRFVGVNPKKKLYHQAFERFLKVESTLSLSFQEFLLVSTGVHSNF